MLFKRNAIAYLRQWAGRTDRKPLVIRGARQVGKTSIVKEFGKEFDLFLSFNLEQKDDLNLFSRETSVGELYESMLIIRHQTRPEGRVLIFIDEIQNSPLAIKMLRYFYEEQPHLYVIAAGSLLETMLNEQVSFPVGRVEYMALRPCSFDEFLGAMGEEELQERVRACSVPAILHKRTMSLFSRYTLIGGMPQAVAHYAEHSDLIALDTIYHSLLAGYADDVEKYQSKQASRDILRFIISHGWAHASERVTFEHFGMSHYKSKEIGEAIRMLQKALLLELTYPTTATALPIIPDMKKRPKLLWLDTGLVNYAAGVQREVFGSEDINDAWRGRIAEHIVGQELLTASNDFLAHRNFWVREARNSQAELDYLYSSRRLGLVPIEVKSGNNSRMRSLQSFMEASSCPLAIRFWGEPETSDTIKKSDGTSFRLLNLPYYYAGQIETIAKDR